MSFDLLLDLFNDVKYRDPAAKVSQYVVKLGNAVMNDSKWFDDATRKQYNGDFSNAVKILSNARRVFRFVRWFKSFDTIPKDLREQDISMRALKLVHNSFGMGAMMCEDITTLGRLTLVNPKTTEPYQATGDMFWMLESLTGLIVHYFETQRQEARVKAAFETLKKANGLPAGPEQKVAKAAAEVALFKEKLKLHLQNITTTKWVCEAVASMIENKMPMTAGQDKVSMAASLLSALLTTYHVARSKVQ